MGRKLKKDGKKINSFIDPLNSGTPYDFLFDYLPTDVIVSKHFGMHYIYYKKKNVLILRKLARNQDLNGIWVATAVEHHSSLQADVPTICNFVLDNGDVHDSAWQLLKESDDDFEIAARKIAELISRGDQRIGKVTAKSITL